MAERPCRQLLCDLRVAVQGDVRTPAGDVKSFVYCAKHWPGVAEAIERTDGAELLGVVIINHEENSMTENQIPLTANEQINNLKTNLNRQEQVLAARNEMIDSLTADKQNLERVNADLKRDVATADGAIGRLKAARHNAEMQLAGAADTQDALVSALHVLADNAEDEGHQDLAEEIDALLAEQGLKPRKQEYTIEILVPTRLHLHVTARSMNHARALYEAGDVDWNVADGEVQDDDIRILAISEGSL